MGPVTNPLAVHADYVDSRRGRRDAQCIEGPTSTITLNTSERMSSVERERINTLVAGVRNKEVKPLLISALVVIVLGTLVYLLL